MVLLDFTLVIVGFFAAYSLSRLFMRDTVNLSCDARNRIQIDFVSADNADFPLVPAAATSRNGRGEEDVGRRPAASAR